MRLGGRIDDSEGLLAGEEYKIWSARDVDGALPEELERVVNRAAAVAGVRVEYMGWLQDTHTCTCMGIYPYLLIRRLWD